MNKEQTMNEITPAEQSAWQAGVDAGREMERQYAAIAQEPVARPGEYAYFEDWYSKEAPDESKVRPLDMARHAWLAGIRFADLFPVAAQALPAGKISRDLLGKIVDEVFDGCCEDTSPIEDIYRVIMREHGLHKQPVSGADGLDAAVDKAWSRFQAAIAPTDDELEEFAGRYADERGCIHDDTHAEMARALLDEFATRHRYASPGATQPQPTGNAGELPPLPEPEMSTDEFSVGGVAVDYYNCDHMRDYARAALAAQADWHKIADERAAEIVRLDGLLAARAAAKGKE